MTEKSLAEWTVGVAGGGNMGAGIAQIATTFGHLTIVLETSPETAMSASKRVQKGLSTAAKRGWLTPHAAHDAAARLHCVHDAAALAEADVVIEAVAEDETIKKAIFARLEQVCRSDALMATNTSSLSLRNMASGMRWQTRFAGMHFFNPAPRMKLVEIINTPNTSPDTSKALQALAHHWGKTPVLAQDAPGFIVNRLARPFYGEALRLLENGQASVAQIDAALRAAGFRMGPFELMDLIGNDVNYSVTESVWQRMGKDARFAPSALQKRMRDAGRLGKKSGAGFYTYDDATGARCPVEEAAAAPPAAPPPQSIILRGSHAGLDYLAQAADDAGIAVDRTAGQPGIAIADCWLLPVEAASGGEHQAVWLDYVADYAACDLFVLYCPGIDAAQTAAIGGFFAALGKAVLPMPNAPAMIALRTIAMLVNIAADAAAEGLASATDMNTAMRCGVNHPHGPFEWMNIIGGATIHRTLTQLAESEEPARYQPCKALATTCHD